MKQGRINSEVLSPRECYRGWNMVAFECGHSAMRLREMQQAARDAKNYDTADKLRATAERLERAIGYFGITYTEGDKWCGATKEQG